MCRMEQRRKVFVTEALERWKGNSENADFSISRLGKITKDRGRGGLRVRKQ